MKIWIFLPPDNTSVFANFKIEFFSSCSCKLRKMSWGEFGIFISQNYSWLGNSCSQHTWIKETYDTHKNSTTKKIFSILTSGVSVGWNVSSLNVSVAESPPGVFLYLGYSKKDSIILTRGRMKIQDEKNIPRWNQKTFVLLLLLYSMMMILRTDRSAEQKQWHKKMSI